MVLHLPAHEKADKVRKEGGPSSGKLVGISDCIEFGLSVKCGPIQNRMDIMDVNTFGTLAILIPFSICLPV
jgi:hypothetical protein